MARTIKKEERDAKRGDVLDAALRLIYTKGYAKMSLQDILDALKISKGALYHYFDSKQQILDALIDRMAAEAQKVVLPVIEDPKLSAIQKLQGYFDASAKWKIEQKEIIIGLMRMWYDEKNDIIRQKLAVESVPQTARVIEAIIRQGIKEKVFTTRFPEQAAVLFAQISIGTSDTVVRLLLSPERTTPKKVGATLDAYIDVIERMLGAPSGSLKAPSPDTFKEWFKGSKKDSKRL
jgi:TetR/AcrR family transcriptional repressor of nem operon